MLIFWRRSEIGLVGEGVEQSEFGQVVTFGLFARAFNTLILVQGGLHCVPATPATPACVFQSIAPSRLCK